MQRLIIPQNLFTACISAIVNQDNNRKSLSPIGSFGDPFVASLVVVWKQGCYTREDSG
jgi:hypothetical protein